MSMNTIRINVPFSKVLCTQSEHVMAQTIIDGLTKKRKISSIIDKTIFLTLNVYIILWYPTKYIYILVTYYSKLA